jgi:DMSO/TMAO reductase YedYZ heme-binding membrane subunit
MTGSNGIALLLFPTALKIVDNLHSFSIFSSDFPAMIGIGYSLEEMIRRNEVKRSKSERVKTAAQLSGVVLLIPSILLIIFEGGKAAVSVTGIITGLFLILCLAMTPLHIIWGIRGGLACKKPFGLYAFGFSVVHGIAHLKANEFALSSLTAETGIMAGVIAALIMLPLALTSNEWAMRKLGKNWKRLQSMSYVVGLLVAAHSFMLGYPIGIIFILLLAVRLPPIRKYFLKRRDRRQASEPQPAT